MTRTRILAAFLALITVVGIAAPAAAVPGAMAQQASDTNQTAGNQPAAESAFAVDSLVAPESAAPDANLTVVAMVSNSGSEMATEPVEFRIDGEVVDRKYVTVEGDESKAVRLSADTEDLESGEHKLGVLTRASGTVDNVTISESFELEDFEAPESANVGDVITVEADVSNPNDFETTQNVSLRLEGSLIAQERLSLDEGDSETVSFDVDTSNLDTGTYVHGILTRDEGEVAELTIEDTENVTEVPENVTEDNVTAGDNVTVPENVTDEPDNVTEEPENVTEEPENVTEDNVTIGDNVTEDNVTIGDNVTEDNVTVGDNVTEDNVTVGDNVTEDNEIENITEDNATEEPPEEELEAQANVSFEEQEVEGQTVTVTNVSLERGGYIAIHDETLLEGDFTGSVIGVSDYLEPGERTNVTIELFDVPGAEFDQTELNGSQRLFAMPHLETSDNEEYDFVASGGEEDGPYVAVQPVTDSARVTFTGVGEDNVTEDNVTVGDNVTEDNVTVGDNVTDENQTTMATANVSFEAQTSNGTAVVVQNVTVEEGGYVAIHDDTLLNGNVIGSVIGVSDYLEPGQYENLTVQLFDVPGAEFADEQLTEDQTLIAMPHMETSGEMMVDNETSDNETNATDEITIADNETTENNTYDFVRTAGQEDGPYLDGGDPVTDAAEITVEAADNVTDENETTENVTDENETTDGVTEDPFADDETTDNVTDGNETDETVTDENETTDNETAMATANVSFADQESNGTTVTVDSVNVSDGGYVAIHNESLQDGVVVDSVIGVSEYLEPGEYEDVEVELYNVSGAEFDASELTENETLIAMPHKESTGDETYNFVETNGVDDPPYVADGNAVTDDAEVTVSDNETAES